MNRIGIGNDIVDLRYSEPPIHSRFQSKVFSERERERIGDRKELLWLHWAAKEAAFKALRQRSKSVEFLPMRFELDLNRRLVLVGESALRCRIQINQDFAYVSCTTNGSAFDTGALREWIGEAGSEVIDDTPTMPAASRAVRRLALKNVSNYLSIPPEDLSIESIAIEGGTISGYGGPSAVPILRIRGHRGWFPLSFTHHGRFVACSFLSDESSAHKTAFFRSFIKDDYGIE